MEKIPFDLERFKAGDVAMTLDGQERYAKIMKNGDVIAVCAEGLARSHALVDSHSHYEYVMKPQPVDADGWIAVKGDGTIPEAIKGAKAGEWEIKWAAFDPPVICNPYADVDAPGIDWPRIVAVRLIKKPESAQLPPEILADALQDRVHKEETIARPAKSVKCPPILPISQNEMLRIAGAAMRDGTKGGGPVVVCDVIAGLMR